MQNQYFKFHKIFILVCVSLIVCSCGVHTDNQLNDSNVEFDDVVTANIGIGLELVSSSSLIDLSGEKWFSFDVVNNSKESIEFTNIHFNLMVFQYDVNNAKWEEIILAVNPRQRIIILPPGDQFSNQPLNSFSLHSDDFNVPLLDTDLRFFISGKGISSGETYGAFVDVPILIP